MKTDRGTDCEKKKSYPNYTVYKLTSPEGKVYIGATSQKPEKRWNGGKGYKHSRLIHNAIKTFGWDSFDREIIAQHLNQAEAEELEIKLISLYRANDSLFGYNIDNGGITGPKHSDITKAKIAEANTRRVWKAESRQKLRDYKLAHPTTPEAAMKISRANTGRKHTPETIERMRRAQPTRAVRNLSTGEVFPSIGSAARAYNTCATHIMKACKGKQKTCQGCKWAYEEVMS